jgi:hypothetical protein
MTFRVAGAGMILALSLAFMPGCGADGPRVVRINGTVTRAGKPVDKLMVNFTPENGRASSGFTNPEGRYTLKYERGRDGAVVGTHKVWFQFKAAGPKEESDLAQGVLKLSPDVSAILQKYGNDKTSPLTVEVKEDNQVIDLPLD